MSQTKPVSNDTELVGTVPALVIDNTKVEKGTAKLMTAQREQEGLWSPSTKKKKQSSTTTPSLTNSGNLVKVNC